jgi:HEAT repeat protein
MKKLSGCVLVLLLAGCGKGDRPGGPGTEAVMSGQPPSYWIQELKNPDPDKRKFATRLLSDHARTDLTVREELLQALTSQDNEVRIGVAGVFGAMGFHGVDAVPALKKMYLDPDPRIQNAVIDALRKIDENELPKIGVSRGIKAR